MCKGPVAEKDGMWFKNLKKNSMDTRMSKPI